MDPDYQLLNIVLLVLAIVLIFISLLLIYCQTFSLKVDVCLLIIPTCCIILLLIFYVGQFDNFGRPVSKSLYWDKSANSARKIDLILLSVSGLFALLFFILIGALMIYCQRVNEANNIEAENHIRLLKNSRGTVELTQKERKQSKVDYSNVDYPIAVSNHLFMDSELMKDPPCQNCNLISMGSMACYQGKCPECGKTPPNRSPV